MASNSVIDLSHHNTVTSFKSAYRSGVVLVIHKASQGRTEKDPAYAGRRQQARSIPEMLWGAYHFGDDSDPIAQADHFLSIIGHETLMVLDWESYTDQHGVNHSMSLAQAEAFVSRIHEKTGRWPMLYSGNTAKEAAIKPGSPLLKCELWLADYVDHPSLPHGWKAWRLWQHTNGSAGPAPHSVPGVGHCDRDKFNGTEGDLRRWFSELEKAA